MSGAAAVMPEAFDNMNQRGEEAGCGLFSFLI